MLRHDDKTCLPEPARKRHGHAPLSQYKHLDNSDLQSALNILLIIKRGLCCSTVARSGHNAGLASQTLGQRCYNCGFENGERWDILEFLQAILSPFLTAV